MVSFVRRLLVRVRPRRLVGPGFLILYDTISVLFFFFPRTPNPTPNPSVRVFWAAHVGNFCTSGKFGLVFSFRRTLDWSMYTQRSKYVVVRLCCTTHIQNNCISILLVAFIIYKKMASFAFIFEWHAQTNIRCVTSFFIHSNLPSK